MKLKVLPLLFIIVFLSSCGTSQIYYAAGSSKASIDLPANNGRTIVLNRMQLSYSTNNNEGYFTPNSLTAMNGALQGLRNEIANRRYFTVPATVRDFKERADGVYAPRLSLEQIKGVSQDADFLISLAMFDQGYRDDYTVEIRREDLGDKVFKEVDYFVGKRTLYLSTGWRLYDARTGELVDEYRFEDEYSYEAESLERVRATELLEANFNREFQNFGMRMGRDYAARISPTNHYTYRTIYTGGNDWLEKGSLAVRREDWVDAEEEWLKGTKRETKRKKLAKLYHNLALAEEKKGNLSKAKEYAKLASNMHPIGRQTQNVVGY